MKKILFLIITSKTHNHGNQLNIDRVDLTRKLDAINTWVGDVLDSGNDVIFLMVKTKMNYLMRIVKHYI